MKPLFNRIILALALLGITAPAQLNAMNPSKQESKLSGKALQAYQLHQKITKIPSWKKKALIKKQAAKRAQEKKTKKQAADELFWKQTFAIFCLFNMAFAETSSIYSKTNFHEKHFNQKASQETTSQIKPFYKECLEKYDKLSSLDILNPFTNNNLKKFRDDWKKDSFKSELKNNNAVKAIVDIANHLRKLYPDAHEKIFTLGQTPSYIVLTAQIIEAERKGNPERFGYIAFSGAGCGLTFLRTSEKAEERPYLCSRWFECYRGQLKCKETKDIFESYYNYLKKINFITLKPTAVTVLEQIESGSSVVVFELVLAKIKEFKLLKNNEHIPTIKWYIHTAGQTQLTINELKDSLLKRKFGITMTIPTNYRAFDPSQNITNWEIKIITYKDTRKLLINKIANKNMDQSEVATSATETIDKIIDKIIKKLNISDDDGVQVEETTVKNLPIPHYFRDIDRAFPEYPQAEAHATKHENLRLIASYRPDEWTSKDPLTFLPHEDAQVRVLRIIDYIKQQKK